MNEAARDTLLHLVTTRRTAALGTLHRGEPAVSMVPFASLGGGTLVIHVSGLATHTADMLASPRVSVMIASEERDDVPAQALPRVTFRATAARLDGDEADAARRAYLARFPDAAPIFDLGDFSLFALRPESARVVAGFGAAFTLRAEDLAVLA